MEPPDNPRCVYLDSDALIRVIQQASGHEPVTEVLRLADADRLTVAISTWSLVEVRGAPLKAKSYSADQDKLILARLDSPKLLQVEFFRNVALRARKYTYELGLKNGDATHLASAVEAGADVLMTFDEKLQKAQLVDGVLVCAPYVPGGDPLPGI